MSDPRDRVEARLRDAMGAYAAGVSDAPGTWARLRARITAAQRSRRLRAPLAALTGVAVAAAAIASVMMLTRDEPDRVEIRPADTAPSPSTEPDEPAPTTPTTTVPAAPQGDDGVIAATADGRVALLRLDGTEVSTLVEARDGEQVTQVALSPDRTHLWYLSKPAGYGGNACGTLYEAPLVDGRADPEATVERGEATHFALSPDGSEYALSVRTDENNEYEPESCDDSSQGSQISVRSADTGAQRSSNRIGLPADNAAENFYQWLAWSPDGAYLAASVCWEDCDIWVIRLDEGVESLLSGEGSLDYAAWTADGRIVANEHCCYPNMAEGSRLVEFDPATGERGEVLVDYADTPLRGLTADPSGERFLVVLYENSVDVWQPPAQPETLAGDVLAAAWAPGLVTGE